MKQDLTWPEAAHEISSKLVDGLGRHVLTFLSLVTSIKKKKSMPAAQLAVALMAVVSVQRSNDYAPHLLYPCH